MRSTVHTSRCPSEAKVDRMFRVAQALNLHRLGPDDPRLYKSKVSKVSKLIIAREVRKRTWYQLVYQGESAWILAFFCTGSFKGPAADANRRVPCGVQRSLLCVKTSCRGQKFPCNR